MEPRVRNTNEADGLLARAGAASRSSCCCFLTVGLWTLGRPQTLWAATLPAGFQESTVFSGLTEPTAVEFASDGRVFVAEKSGLIKVFDDIADGTPTVFADLRTNVHGFWDRGLLGLALDPNFPTRPYVYVLYTYDAPIGGTAPTWGTVGGSSDGCPTPPGATGDGCVVSGRLSRLTASGNVMTGNEQVLIENWCQQYPSHSVGDLAFGADGALYVSSGEGASFNFSDYGQDGNPLNPCGDPPVRGRRRPNSTNRRGRRAPKPGPANRRRSRSASAAPFCAWTPTPARACPATRCSGAPIPTPAASSPTARAIPSA